MEDFDGGERRGKKIGMLDFFDTELEIFLVRIEGDSGGRRSLLVVAPSMAEGLQRTEMENLRVRFFEEVCRDLRCFVGSKILTKFLEEVIMGHRIL